MAASEEMVIESLAMMREEARAEQNEPLQREEVRHNPFLIKIQILGDIHLLTPDILKVMMNLSNGRLKGGMLGYQEREKKR